MDSITHLSDTVTDAINRAPSVGKVDIVHATPEAHREAKVVAASSKRAYYDANSGN